MKILVTGSTGLIGSHLVQALNERGHDVFGYDKKAPRAGSAYKSIEGDLLDKAGMVAAFCSFKPEIVFHLAARTSLKEVSPGDSYFDANTIGTSNVIDACNAAGTVKRIIFTSTKYVHRGMNDPGHREYSPTTSYGRSKAEMEEIIWNSNNLNQEWCITRPTTVWGPGMSSHYQGLLRMIEKRRYFHIGRSDVKKHMIYVGNIAYQYCQLAEADASSINKKVFYMAEYEPMTVRGWTNALQVALDAPPIPTFPMFFARMAALLGDLIVKLGFKKFPFTSFRLHNLTVDDVCGTKLTESVCGKLPYTLSQGVNETVTWFRNLKTES